VVQLKFIGLEIVVLVTLVGGQCALHRRSMDKIRDPRKLRNLAQYNDLSDEEFNDAMDELFASDFEADLLEKGKTFSERVKTKMEEFERDYDLTDMKYNDTQTLEVLCKSLVTMEDYDDILVTLRTGGLRDLAQNITLIDKFSNITSNIKKDISKAQEDLKISRKSRKASREESAMAELKRLREAARRFYNKVHSYIYCDECHMLLGTVWFNYPDEDNEISLTCSRIYYDNEGKEKSRCGHVTTVTSKQLMESEGTNHHEGFIF